MASNYMYDEEKKAEITSSAKKVVALLFFFFLLSFNNYLPYEHRGEVSNSFWASLFNLYFFVFNQTLGIVHEGGHGVCYVLHCPEFVTALNGTVFQLLFPLGIAYYYRRKKNKIASYIALFFVGFSLLYTAWYISTSNQGAIVSAANSFLGVDGYHDFYFILSSLGVLEHYAIIATITKVISYLIMYFSVAMMLFEGFIYTPKKRRRFGRRRNLIKIVGD